MARIVLPEIINRLIENSPDLVFNQCMNIKELLKQLIRLHPRLEPYILDSTSASLPPFIIVTLNNIDISCLKGLETEIRDTDIIHIIPALSGG